MSPDERKLLDDLFARTRAAANDPRDPQAEALIADAIRTQPYAPYLLSQAVILQDQALRAAADHARQQEDRIAELERRTEHQPASAGSFLGGLFASPPVPHAETTSVTTALQPSPPQGPAGPWSNQPQSSPAPGPWGAAPGSGFLRGAMGTAAGVAGGMLLANSLGGLFGGNHGLFGGAGGFAQPQDIIEENIVNNNNFGSNDDANTTGSDDFLDTAGAADDSSGFFDDSDTV